MKSYAPHETRVIDEKAELDTKINALAAFMDAEDNRLFKELPVDERDRLGRQRLFMKSYSEILGERIAAFAGDYIAPPLTKSDLVRQSKTFRQALDSILQKMKAGKARIMSAPSAEMEDHGEVIAQHVLSTRDLESAIMRLGMALKYTGNPDPYPHSKDPSSPVVEPTADGLSL